MSFKIRPFLMVLLGSFALTGHSALSEVEGDRRAVEAVFAVHDLVYKNAENAAASLDAYLGHVADDVILMPNNATVIEGKAAYRKHIEDSLPHGQLVLRHELIAIYPFQDLVVARGRAIGTFTARGETTAHPFETKNIFLFRRSADGLKVWQIIFNHSPVSPAAP